MAKKPETNVERVTYLMEHSRAGALIQPFVIEAIRHYADACIAKGPRYFDSPMLNGTAWIRAAEDAKAWVNKNYP